MSIIDSLITDRTRADVERVKYLASKGWEAMTEQERAEWLTPLKGAYNAEDLNRVGRAVKYLSNLLEEYGYAAPVTARRDWTQEDIPNQRDMAVYLADVRTLMDAYCVLPTTPELPESMRKLGYQGANAIEQTLVDIHILILNMAAAWCYSGEIYAGEV